MAAPARVRLMLQPGQSPTVGRARLPSFQPDLPAASTLPEPAPRSLRRGLLGCSPPSCPSAAAAGSLCSAISCQGSPWLRRLWGGQHSRLSPRYCHLRGVQDVRLHCPDLTLGRWGWRCDLHLLRPKRRALQCR